MTLLVEIQKTLGNLCPGQSSRDWSYTFTLHTAPPDLKWVRDYLMHAGMFIIGKSGISLTEDGDAILQIAIPISSEKDTTILTLCRALRALHRRNIHVQVETEKKAQGVHYILHLDCTNNRGQEEPVTVLQ